jgi:protein-disulfide isomerase
MHDTKISHYLIPLAVLIAGGLVVLAVWSQGAPNDDNEPEVPIEVGVGSLPALGDENAPITLIEFSDFQCSFCASFFANTEMKFRSELIETGKMKIYWRDFAFLGPESEAAAQAARCANEQDKFWQYHDLLFLIQDGEGQGGFSKGKLKLLANELELNDEQFDQCLDSNRYYDAVREDTRAGRDLNIQGTPTVFINGERIVGAQPYEFFENVINEILGE